MWYKKRYFNSNFSFQLLGYNSYQTDLIFNIMTEVSEGVGSGNLVFISFFFYSTQHQLTNGYIFYFLVLKSFF